MHAAEQVKAELLEGSLVGKELGVSVGGLRSTMVNRGAMVDHEPAVRPDGQEGRWLISD